MLYFCDSRVAMLTAAASLATGCASSQTPPPADPLPRAAGTLAASTTTCRVTGAWSMSGEAVPPPTVTRCVLPWYPASMRTANQDGEIVFRIAIDGAGLPDSSSLRVVRTSTPALVPAVQAAAPYLRFAPALSRPVIVVEIPYTFTIGR
jgi:hypothetical protein